MPGGARKGVASYPGVRTQTPWYKARIGKLKTTCEVEVGYIQTQHFPIIIVKSAQISHNPYIHTG